MKVDPKLAIVVALSLSVALTARSLQNSSNNSSQSAQPAASPTSNTPGSQAGAASTATPQPQPESLADRARKAKATGQPQSGAKPKVFNQDNFATATSPKAPQDPKSNAANVPANSSGSKSTATSSSAALPVDKIDIMQFKPAKTTITRPGGSTVEWMIQNKSDHPGPVTLTFIVTGPCNYKSENSETPNLMPGSGYTDNMLASVAFYESDCAGQYTIELSASAGGKVLNSKTSSITVQ